MILRNQLEQIIEGQTAWTTAKRKEIARDTTEATKAIEGFATIITGIRRCGKSTLMRQIMKKYAKEEIFFINFDDIHLTGFEADDFTRLHAIIVDKKVKVLFFDEIQLIPSWEIFIHQLLREEYLIYITGSNASMLSIELGSHLTGRHLSTELFPFSYDEYLSFTKQTKSIDSFSRYLHEGGMPEHLATRDYRVLPSLLDDILTRDIAIRQNIKNIEPLKRLALYLLTNVAKPFSGNRLTSIIGNIANSTVLEYVEYMRDAYLLDTIGQYADNFRTTVRNPKKVYAIDTGIAHSLTLSKSEDKGRLFENHIFLQLRKRARNHIYYFRSEGECDFVVTGADNKPQELYQVCLSLNEENMAREINGLKEAMRTLNIKEGKIITLNEEETLNVQEGTIYIKKAF